MSESDGEETVLDENAVAREPRVGCFVMITPSKQTDAVASHLYEVTRIVDGVVDGEPRRVLELNNTNKFLTRSATNSCCAWSEVKPCVVASLAPTEFETIATPPLCADVMVIDPALGDAPPHHNVCWYDPCRSADWIQLDDGSVERVVLAAGTVPTGEAVFLAGPYAVSRLRHPVPHWRVVVQAKITKANPWQWRVADDKESVERSQRLVYRGMSPLASPDCTNLANHRAETMESGLRCVGRLCVDDDSVAENYMKLLLQMPPVYAGCTVDQATETPNPALFDMTLRVSEPK